MCICRWLSTECKLLASSLKPRNGTSYSSPPGPCSHQHWPSQPKTSWKHAPCCWNHQTPTSQYNLMCHCYHFYNFTANFIFRKLQILFEWSKATVSITKLASTVTPVEDVGAVAPETWNVDLNSLSGLTFQQKFTNLLLSSQ